MDEVYALVKSSKTTTKRLGDFCEMEEHIEINDCKLIDVYKNESLASIGMSDDVLKTSKYYFSLFYVIEHDRGPNSWKMVCKSNDITTTIIWRILKKELKE